MRVALASRIFEPEAAAAAFRLRALAERLVADGHEVTVLTVKPPKHLSAQPAAGYRVRRFPVLRDRTGYVRGYLQYLSFDVPLFFRILFGAKVDLVVAEPPPTTGFFVRAAAALRRVPYAYYAADIWSDATAQTDAPRWVVRAVRRVERIALHGARNVLSVSAGVTERIGEFAPQARVHTVGNGVDTAVFSCNGPSSPDDEGLRPYAIYPGTASEWQGAGIFIDALARVRERVPDASIVFLGQGSDWAELRRRAAALPEGAVRFVSTVTPREAAAWVRGATVTLASIRPDAGYDFAFPTKVQAGWACGTPVVFAGPTDGVVAEYFRAHGRDARLGVSTDYTEAAVGEALGRAFSDPVDSADRETLGAWAAEHVSLDAVAASAVRALETGAER